MSIKSNHDAVLSFLNDGNWHTANSIWYEVGVTPTAMRALCQEKQGSYISSPRGYKRADLASDIEIAACISDLMLRAKAILDRAATLERRRSYLALPAKKAKAS